MSNELELATIETVDETRNIEESANLPVAIPVCTEEREPYITEIVDFRQLYKRSRNLSNCFGILSCISAVALVVLIIVVLV